MTAAIDTRPSAYGELARARNAGCAAGTARALPDLGVATDSTADERLMARVAQGDRRAIQMLFERYQLMVYRFVLRLVADKTTAEDIVSEVFITLWRQAADFEGRARLSTWILAIARNKAVSAIRGRSHQPLDDAMLQAIPDRAISAEETVAASQRSATLRTCLMRLSPAHREIIDLVYYHEKSVEEVAIILRVPAATVKTRMFYARRRLALHLNAAGITTAQS